MGILDHLRVNRIFVSKHVPKVAKTAERYVSSLFSDLLYTAYLWYVTMLEVATLYFTMSLIFNQFLKVIGSAL